MAQQELVQVEIPVSTYQLLETVASRESRPATSIIEDSLRMYAERAEDFRRMADAIQAMQQEAILNGTSGMPLDEIDEEIARVRQEMASEAQRPEC